jgi:hypothetical protein
VSIERTADDGIIASITLPEGLDGHFVWDGQEVAISSGTQEVSF